MESIEVREKKREEYYLWDQLVENSSQGTIFHNSDWLSTCSNLLNKKIKIYGCFENDQIVAGCSFHPRRIGFLKVAYSNLETTPFGGIIYAKPRSVDSEKHVDIQEIMQSIRIALESDHFDYLQLVNSPDLRDIRAFKAQGWKQSFSYTYYIDLSSFEEKISKDLRWSIKKAIKNGVTIEKSKNIDVFNEMLKETFKRQNLGPFASECFYRKVFDLLQVKS